MLSDRRQRVLAALIEEYVARALPVGSRTLVERYQLGVSPATVRNELSVLENGGYIVQPHTSAGRVPTDAGYRAFVDNLLNSSLVEIDARCSQAVDNLRKEANELDELLEKTSETLTRLTDCLSVVLAPSVLTLRVKQISLISISDFRALVVLVTQDGRVFNRQIDFDTPVKSDDLALVQHLMSEVFDGKTLDEAKESLKNGMDAALRDPVVRTVLCEVMSCLQESEGARAHRIGMSALMKKPEFSQAENLLPVVEMLEDDTVLLHILDNAATRSEGPSVSIGSENEAPELSGVSVVASRYGTGARAGVVAVIGPTRMNYSQVIRAVQAASSALDTDASA